MAASSPTPLWRQLQAAASVIEQVRAGASTTTALERVPGALRPAAQALSYQSLRQLGRATALREQLARRAPPPAADALLCTALALAWDPSHAPYEPFTLVDQAVEAAKRNPQTRGQANFINACLRRFLRDRDALVRTTEDNVVARWNHPAWWIAQLQRDHPRDWEGILAASNRAAPMTLRVNARGPGRDAVQLRLREAGVDAVPGGPQALVLERPRPVQELPGFAEGHWSVQDAAAQMASPLLLDGITPAGARLRVLDACAAPGGKTAHLLELAPDAEVLALDADPQRCERIHATLARLRLVAEVRAADAGAPAQWWDGRPFDAILLDAPCTASGIVRRHPDVRWLRRPTDIDQLATIQTRLLNALWPLLRPGGRLLYCTCSVFRAEGEARVQAFLAHNTEAVLRPAPGHLLPQGRAKGDAVPDNLASDHDGFFYALLEKRAGTGRPGASG